MKKILFLLLLPVLVFGQSKNQNFVKTKVYKAPSTQILQSSDTIVNIQYLDGIGREMQNIAYRQGGTGQDIVTPIEYEDYSGRQTIQYLPYANPFFAVNSPNYRDNTTLVTTQKSYYKAQFPADFAFKSVPSYSHTIAESSPLGRVTEQAAPGDAWALSSGHTIKFGYDTNTSTDQVYDFKVRFINGNTEQPEIYLVYNLRVSTQYYSGLQLYKTTVKNENWKTTDGNNNTTVEFKDKQGRLILNRKYDLGVAHDTYYVYDDYGNLTFVITPQAFADPQFITEPVLGSSYLIKQSVIDNLCYTYKYDSRNRLVEKMSAGKVVATYTDNAEYIVYDKLDRPVFTQNGNQRAANKWLFTKYDKFDRVVYTGECVFKTELNINNNRATLQNLVNSASIISEIKTATSTFSSNGGAVYYTKDAYSDLINTFELFTVNYYDNYTFTRTGISIPTATDYGVPVTTALTTLPTGTMKRVLGSTTWMTSAVCYDAKGRVVWSKTSQPLYTTYTTFQSNLNFMGQPIETKQNHIRSTSGAEQNIEIIDNYTYSFNRLVDHTQKINGAPVAQRIAAYTYNELGVLTKKGVGGLSTASTPQQAIDYKYNVRGWLTKINDVASLGTDLFAETINYNQPTSGTALYNGNISQVSWMTANDLQKRNYNYTYDALNRIKTGVFTNSNNATQNNSFNLNSITYDRNGNITFLQRNGTSAQTDLDKMTYIYDGNALQRISEAGIQAAGFITTKAPGDTTVQYTYDKNGNLLTDTNKKITSTTYNYLNLPVRITFSDGRYIEYTYNAAGEKVKKYIFNLAAATSSSTEYNLGFVYEKVGSAASAFRYIPTKEGYAYKNADGITFNYAIQLKDHLNNVRVSFSETDGNAASISTAEIIEEANYDPFGLKHTGYNNTSTGTGVALGQKIEFNNREFEEASAYNMNEMDWRHYDPAIGRFVCIDKLQEVTYQISPYVYCRNNPVIFVDPSGLISQRNSGVDQYGRQRFDSDGNYIPVYERGDPMPFDMGSYMAGGDGYGNIRQISGPGGGGDDPITRFLKWIFGGGKKSSVEVGEFGEWDSEIIGEEPQGFYDGKYDYTQASLTGKVGTYVDVGLKYIGSITAGFYTESGKSYSFTEGVQDVRAKKFALGYSNEVGFMYTYDFLTEQHTFGVAVYGVGYEYNSSSLRTVNASHFLGFLTGVSGGVGVGGELSVKHGYKF